MTLVAAVTGARIAGCPQIDSATWWSPITWSTIPDPTTTNATSSAAVRVRRQLHAEERHDRRDRCASVHQSAVPEASCDRPIARQPAAVTRIPVL